MHAKPPSHHRSDLVRIAIHAMSERGLEPEFSSAVERQLDGIAATGASADPGIHDLSTLLWCSIDNDDSMDLDQLTVSEALPNGSVRLWVAIADVDALVPRDTPIDQHASTNTTSVYTSARIFPMLPERLSTDLTSLNPHQDRLAMVTEMVFNPDGSLAGSTVYRAKVRNQAKLAYDAVSAWLDGQGDLPAAAAAVPGLDALLRTQDALAQQLRARRHGEGSLEFESFQPRVTFDGERVSDIHLQEHNRARQLIEEVMIATNTCTARYLAGQGVASLRRVVRSPERWLRIVGVAKEYAAVLPDEPDSKALEDFLAKRRRADPLRFADLSLVIVKLMGRGEYVLEAPGGPPVGHFGLAVTDYTHSTAPNRRFPDLITARLLKATLAKEPPPYSNAELAALATHSTRQEDAAQKVERQMRKSEAALLLESRIGQRFDAIVTGNAADGLWVRLLNPPAEGKLLRGANALKVGDKVRVKLLATNVERGFIDFESAQ
ncbi:RNB domain-containing ribonuclease [Rhodoferax sp. TS-BS-61-7]|uniref:RNB domain-containing ribonuclease n=1 Tax=Rhodoferax sp. TS-BS-61-7 TaxID=2094194 RepID=UPI000CF64473|nr:RNB domain-containing ribonuclease [Rhodoferax sp. TS-BS-61-7]PQA76358.1 ribonuclease II [Rhodoferax sp. TS-BS-61-7]